MRGRGKTAAVVAAVAVSAGGGAAANAASGSASASKHQSRSVHLRVHQTVTVKLPENPSTGYHWVTRNGPAKRVLRRVSAHFAQDKCPPGVVGCGGHAIYRYRAEGHGKTSVLLALRPPGGGRAAQTYHLRVTVR